MSLVTQLNFFFFFNLAKLDLKEVTNQTQSPYCVCVTLTSS